MLVNDFPGPGNLLSMAARDAGQAVPTNWKMIIVPSWGLGKRFAVIDNSPARTYT